MNEYALLIANTFREIRRFGAKPANIPHKNVTWHLVVREFGLETFAGVENNNWVIRTALPTFEQLKAEKLNALADKRWEVETGGITFGSFKLATDVTSQTKYIGAVVGAQIDPTSIVNWKMDDGTFVELNATEITEIAMIVRSHIQACFDKEAELRGLIEASTNKDDLDAIDINVDWPA
jgi:hypothetical protein